MKISRGTPLLITKKTRPIGFVKNISYMFSGYNLVMLDKHCTTMLVNVNYILQQVPLLPTYIKQ